MGGGTQREAGISSLSASWGLILFVDATEAVEASLLAILVGEASDGESGPLRLVVVCPEDEPEHSFNPCNSKKEQRDPPKFVDQH